MTLRPGATMVLLTTLSMAACSLRSLDYLERSDGGAGTSASTGGDGGAAGGTGAVISGSGGGGGSDTSGSAGTASPEAPDCSDSLSTVDETDVDCGGRTCAPCTDGRRCLAGTDCQSGICTNQVCQKPTCSDLAVNGDETDLNCGGSCPQCSLSMHCQADADCASHACQQGVCVSPTCVDDVLSDACPLLVDNTPYSLSPSHALGKCVDDGGLSVAEGNAMILFDCKDELEQSFWAVAQPEGYFAFRSALSGLCLQARGSSTAEGTAIEQRACDYAPAQLWKPSRVDDSVMQLSNKLSALLLDVAGDNATNDSQPIVQSKSDAEAPDMRWRLRRRATAAYFTLAPDDDRLRYLQHRGSEITLAADDAESAHWRVVPGLADASCVSFQSRDEPGRYLRHASFRIWADLNDGSSLFAFDATFRYKNPFAGSAPFTHAIESLNYSGKFWLRRDAVVALSSRDDASTFDRGATWWLAAR